MRLLLALGLVIDALAIWGVTLRADTTGQETAAAFTMGIGLVYAVVGGWVLLRPGRGAYLAALALAGVSTFLLVIGGYLSWMGSEIGSPGSSTVVSDLAPYVVLQIAMVVLAVLLVIRAEAEPPPPDGSI